MGALCLLFVAGVSPAQPPIPDSLTAENAIKMALENNPAIRQTEYGVDAAQARVGTNRSSYYPDITFTGSYARLDPVSAIEMTPQISIKTYPNDNLDFHLGFRHILYDFGKTSTAVHMAESGEKSAREYVDLVKSILAYQTIAVFDAILILHQNISVLDEQIEVLNQHRDISMKRVEAGSATDFDVLTTQVRIANAKNERIDATGMLESREIIFRQLTGLPPDFPISLKGEFSRDSVIPNPDSLLQLAYSRRSEIALSREAENSAIIQRSLASFGNKPSLALTMTSGFKNGYFPDISELQGNISAGVQLQVPAFNGHRTKYQESEADANILSAKSHTEDIRRQIASEVQQAIAGVKSSLEKIQNSEVQVKQAEAALAMARTRYEAGVVANLDLLDAETTLSQAKLIFLRAMYNYAISLTFLDKATGKKIW